MAKVLLTIEGDNAAEVMAEVFALAQGRAVTAPAPQGEDAEPGEKSDVAETPAPKRTRAKAADKADTARPTEATPASPATAPEPATAASAPAATASASSGPTATTAASPSEGGAVTYEMCKEAMTRLLDKTSAGAALAVLTEATGKRSLSQLDASEWAKAHAALTAAAA
jgi:hypothetical protein